VTTAQPAGYRRSARTGDALATLGEPKSRLTSARAFDTQTTQTLAYWLDNDARTMDGQARWNDHVAATRAASERLLAAWAALGFIDMTISANEDHSEVVTWDNAEVLELLREVRALLVGQDPTGSR
jgi:hypothetical protein